MAGQGFSFRLFPNQVNRLRKAQLTAAKLTAEKMLSEKIEQQQIPFDEGTLQNVQSFVDDQKLVNEGKVQIIHDTKYAMKLYYHPEYNFSTQLNQNARGEWWEDYISGANKKRAQQIYGHYLRRNTGGIIQ